MGAAAMAVAFGCGIVAAEALAVVLEALGVRAAFRSWRKRLPAIAMARDSAETACPAPVLKDCQARAESIAQPLEPKD